MIEITPEMREQILEEVRVELANGMDEGTRCPCCGHLVKLYKRKLNATMARLLTLVVRRYGITGDWIGVREDLGGVSIGQAGGEFAKLAHWGLVEQEYNDNPDKRTSGRWRPTDDGHAFVYRRLSVPEHVLLLSNEVIGFTDTEIGIVQALGSRFSYEELMNESP